jgi:hypothetical protein
MKRKQARGQRVDQKVVTTAVHTCDANSKVEHRELSTYESPAACGRRDLGLKNGSRRVDETHSDTADDTTGNHDSSRGVILHWDGLKNGPDRHPHSSDSDRSLTTYPLYMEEAMALQSAPQTVRVEGG